MVDAPARLYLGCFLTTIINDMDTPIINRLLLGCGAIAGSAAVTTLWPGAAIATAAGLAAGGIGTHFLNQCSDKLAKKLAASPAYARDYLQNDDLRRIVGETTAAKLKAYAIGKDFDDATCYRLEVLALKAAECWLAVADANSLQGLNEDVVTRLFAMSSDNFNEAKALDAEVWAGFLKYLDGRVSDASIAQKVKRIVTPGGKAVGTKKLTKATRLLIGGKLTDDFPHALHISAKRAFEKNDPAYAALQLRLMRDMMTDVRDILATVSGTSDRLEELFTGQQQIEAHLSALSQAIQTRAPVVGRAVGNNSGLDVESILGEINTAHTEVMAKLDKIAKGVEFIEQQFKTHGVQIAPKSNNNFDLVNITDNRATLKGRDGVLADLHQACINSDDPRVVVISGGTGRGKSAIARRYVFHEDYAEKWPHRYWLQAQTGVLETSASELLKRIIPNSPAKEPADVRGAILEFAARVGALLVLDNVDDPVVINQWRPNKPARAIATTIRSDFSPQNGLNFELPTLSEEAADDILWSHRGNEPRPEITYATSAFSKQPTGERTDAMAQIARHVRFNALGLNYMAACLNKTIYADPEKLLEALKTASLSDKSHPLADVKSASTAPDHHAQGMADAYDVLVRDVMGTPAEPVLLAAAHLNADSIPMNLLSAGAGLDDVATANALDTLRDGGVLEWDGESASLHRFTQDMARFRASEENDSRNETTLYRLIDALIQIFSDTSNHELFQHRNETLPHVESVLDGAPQSLDNQSNRLRSDVAWHLVLIGQLSTADKHINAAIEWGEQQTPRDERSLAIWYASRSRVRKDRGDLDGAEEDLQKSIEWGEKQTPRDERSLAIDYTSRSSIRQARGDLDGAEEDLQKSIEWGEQQTPRDERSLAIRYALRSRIRRAQASKAKGDGMLQLAVELIAKAKDDIANALNWYEANLPGDARSIGIYRKDQARIEQVAHDIAEDSRGDSSAT